MADLDCDFRLRFLGFDPSMDQRRKAKSVLFELYMDAPSESCVNAAIQPFGEKFEGWVTIQSPERTFSTYATGHTAEDVAHGLYEQGSMELKAWKKQRHFGDEDQPRLA